MPKKGRIRSSDELRAIHAKKTWVRSYPRVYPADNELPQFYRNFDKYVEENPKIKQILLDVVLFGGNILIPGSYAILKNIYDLYGEKQLPLSDTSDKDDQKSFSLLRAIYQNQFDAKELNNYLPGTVIIMIRKAAFVQRILEKNGLTDVGEESIEDILHEVYSSNNEYFLSKEEITKKSIILTKSFFEKNK